MPKRLTLKSYRTAIFRRDKWHCTYCGVKVHKRDPHCPNRATIDHIVPRSMDGMSVDENMTTACKRCNQQKASKSVEEFTPTPTDDEKEL